MSADTTRRQQDEWVERFRKRGYSDATHLATGMEARVYRLGTGLIGKVWKFRNVGELKSLQMLYDEVRAQGFRFQLPRIETVERAHGATVTLEAELPGQPLQAMLDPLAANLHPFAGEAVLMALEELARVRETPVMRQLVVLDESRPLWSRADQSWSEVLVALVSRRVERYGSQLRARVTDFDSKLTALRRSLLDVDGGRRALVHGDLVPANVMVDKAGQPLAVIDFGFLSTLGDPAFDAAVATSIVNMYGKHAEAIDAELTDAVVARLRYPRRALLVYKAAYAVITSNAYDPAGRDGHFAWCANVLQRPAVTQALLAD